jgi:hypothetical protein
LPLVALAIVGALLLLAGSRVFKLVNHVYRCTEVDRSVHACMLRIMMTITATTTAATIE